MFSCGSNSEVSLTIENPKIKNSKFDKFLVIKLDPKFFVKGELLNLLRNYLHERNQRVILNGQISSSELIKSGVPQGSVLGPLFFLIYINDLPGNVQSTCKIFANGTSLYKVN